MPNKLLRELQRGSEQPDGGKRLYKLDVRRAHLTDAHVSNALSRQHLFHELNMMKTKPEGCLLPARLQEVLSHRSLYA